jgi:hypothetical protein
VITVPGSELGQGRVRPRRMTCAAGRDPAYKPMRSTAWTGQIKD